MGLMGTREQDSVDTRVFHSQPKGYWGRLPRPAAMEVGVEASVQGLNKCPDPYLLRHDMHLNSAAVIDSTG